MLLATSSHTDANSTQNARCEDRSVPSFPDIDILLLKFGEQERQRIVRIKAICRRHWVMPPLDPLVDEYPVIEVQKAEKS